jgi:hypothetical protein
VREQVYRRHSSLSFMAIFIFRLVDLLTIAAAIAHRSTPYFLANLSNRLWSGSQSRGLGVSSSLWCVSHNGAVSQSGGFNPAPEFVAVLR